jgi:serine/threonine protein kinase
MLSYDAYTKFHTIIPSDLLSVLSGVHPFDMEQNFRSTTQGATQMKIGHNNLIVDRIKKTDAEFAEKPWKTLSTGGFVPRSIVLSRGAVLGATFVSSLLCREPKTRPTIKEAFQHSWISKDSLELHDRYTLRFATE